MSLLVLTTQRPPPKPKFARKNRRKTFNTKDLVMPSVIMDCRGNGIEEYNRQRTTANQIKKSTKRANLRPGQKPVRLGRVRWWFKQLIPHTDWAIYNGAEHRRRLVIWKSWLGKQTVILDINLNH